MKQIFFIVGTSFTMMACHNQADQNLQTEVNQAKQQAVDSMKMIMMKQQVVDSMKKEEAKTEGKAADTTSAAPHANSPVAVAQPAAAAEQPKKKKGMSGAGKGAIIGGVTGAVAGAIIDKKHGEGAVVGGLVGAGVGAATGAIIDKEKKKKEAQ